MWSVATPYILVTMRKTIYWGDGSNTETENTQVVHTYTDGLTLHDIKVEYTCSDGSPEPTQSDNMARVQFFSDNCLLNFDGTEFDAGVTQTFSATPAPGYVFKGWYECDANGNIISKISDAQQITLTLIAGTLYLKAVAEQQTNEFVVTTPYQYTMLNIYGVSCATTIRWGDGNVTLLASDGIYVHKYSTIGSRNITITQNCDSNTLQVSTTDATRSVTVVGDDGCSVSGGGDYCYGDSVTISATPHTCYNFTKWNDGNTNATRTITNITTSLYFAATTTKKRFTISSTPSPTYTVKGLGTYDCGSEITITVTPASGYRFVRWNDGNTRQSRTIIVSENITLTPIVEEVNDNICLPTINHSHSFTNIGTFAVNSTCSDVYISMPQSSRWVLNSFGVAITSNGNFITNPTFSTDNTTYTSNEERIVALTTMFPAGYSLNIHAASSNAIRLISSSVQPYISVRFIGVRNNIVDSHTIVNNLKSLMNFNNNGVDFSLMAYENCVGVMIVFENVTFDPTQFTISIKK